MISESCLQSYNSKIADFGLAKLGPSASQSHVTTRIMGTYGYAAPEYVATGNTISSLLTDTTVGPPQSFGIKALVNWKFSSILTGHLYVKSDVYGFGVVLVELLTGLRALDTTRPTGKHTLVDWIKPHLSDKRKLKRIMDTRLEGKYPSKAAIATAELALNCLAQEPRARPSMQEVLESLENIQGMVQEKQRVSRKSSTGSASARPHRHSRQNVVRSHQNSIHSR